MAKPITAIGGVITSNALNANIDALYGTYDTVADAHNALGARRLSAACCGLTVGIKDTTTGVVTEYWVQPYDNNGVTAYHLVEKQALQGQSQGGGAAISVETDPENLSTLSQSMVYILGPGTWTAFSPAVTVAAGKFGVAKYGTSWEVTVLGGGDLAAAISGMTAATSVELTDTLPLGSGEAATVQQIAEAAEALVLDDADTDGTGEDTDLATVGSVKALIDGQEGKMAEPITAWPQTPNTNAMYFIDNSNGNSAITIGDDSVPAGATAHAYYENNAWVVVVDEQGGGVSAPEVVEINTAAAVIASLQGNKVYRCTASGGVTSLTVTAFDASTVELESIIELTTAASFTTLSLPATSRYAPAKPILQPSTQYVMSCKGGIWAVSPVVTE